MRVGFRQRFEQLLGRPITAVSIDLDDFASFKTE
jgi:hypothetical protein